MKQLFFILFAAMLNAAAFSQEVRKIRIDPAKSYGGSVSEFYETVEYTPLETTKESMFEDITILTVTDSSYVIYDDDTHSILFFDLAGKFISKVKTKDIHDKTKDIHYFPNISFNKKENIISTKIYDPKTEKKWFLKYYTLNGVEITDTSLTTKYKKEISSSNLLEGEFRILRKINRLEDITPILDSTKYFIHIYKGDSLYKSFLPHKPKDYLLHSAFPDIIGLSNTGKGIVYASIPYNHEVYKITKDTAEKILQFDFPTDISCSQEILTIKNIEAIDSLKNTGWTGRDIIISVDNIVFNGDILFFRTRYRNYQFIVGSESTKQYNFMYNLKTGALTSFERIHADKTNYFLPFNKNIRTKTRGLIYHEDYAYTYVTSLDMFTQPKKKSEKLQYPPVLQEYFKTQDRKSNPVIVKMKMKK